MLKALDNVLSFRGNVRKVAVERQLDFSDVTDSAIENLAVAKAVIVLQDTIARNAKKNQRSIEEELAQLPNVVDMSEYVNGYNARTDKQSGVSSLEKAEKRIEKADADELAKLEAILEARKKELGMK